MKLKNFSLKVFLNMEATDLFTASATLTPSYSPQLHVVPDFLLQHFLSICPVR